MIVTVTANPALDVTYRVKSLTPPHTTHRVAEVHEQAGGKGVNVSRVLATLGRRTIAVLPLAGTNGAAVRNDLRRAGVTHCVVPSGAPTRRTVAGTVAGTDDRDYDVTVLNQPGAAPYDGWWHTLTGVVDGLLSGAQVLVISGSLPVGLPSNAYRALVTLARNHGLPVILDSDGPPLTAALDARPTLVKPDAAELLAVTGLTDPLDAARALRDLGAQNVIASMGPDGLLAVTSEGTWRAFLPDSLSIRGNPAGAGDAAVASLAAALADATPWPEALTDAVALSAATVAAPRAGRFDHDLHQALLPAVHIESL
ncbi:1-phosphofructokinase family hexose kinase [Kitasatospora sp. NPDC057015]|uniref:1-phosphofructokinase family hexose kinase n=1 Tax=Kitasatospora sp. NPDC057015 TaxID=3346001 RepID=UPI003633F053